MMVYTKELQHLCDFLTGKMSRADIIGAEWNQLLKIARQHRVLSLVRWQLNAGFQSKNSRINFRDAAQDLGYREAQITVSKVLAAHNIPALWLKGSVLRLTVYPASLLRTMLDLDVLVPYSDRLEAVQILQASGFELKPFPHSLRDANADALDDRHHHFVLRSKKHPWLILEVHFHLLGAVGRTLLSQEDLAWFIEQNVPYPLNSELSILIPRPETHLLYLCAHTALQHGLEDFDLRRYLDIHLLVTAAVINWDSVIEHAVRLRWSYAVECVLLITKKLFDTPIPAQVFEQIRLNRKCDENIYLVHDRASDWADWSRFWYSLRPYSWRERLQRMWEAASPPRDYMQYHYAIPLGSPVWPYYLRRWGSQIRSLIRLSKPRDILHELQ